MEANKYSKITSDHCVVVKKFSDNDFVILLLYVDNIQIVSHDTVKIEKLKKELNKSFAIKDLGPTK